MSDRLLQIYIDRYNWMYQLLEIIREYPDFDNGGPLADAIDQALAGEKPTMLGLLQNLVDKGVVSRGWNCGVCGTDRTKAPCPKGHEAALTGRCPMSGRTFPGN